MTRPHFAVPPVPSHGIPLRITLVARGFTLLELAIVLFVVALLVGGMLLPLAAQQDVRNYADTQQILTEARDALLGFAIANDRLPCPASAASNGVESPAGGGTCTNPYDGFLPAVTLGLSPVDGQGYRLDGWGGETFRRLRYAITTSNSNAFSRQNGMKTATMSTLASPPLTDLVICSTGTGLTGQGTATPACAINTTLAGDAVAVVYSLGKNAATGGSTVSENHNPNPQSTLVTPDRAFVNAPQGSTFDDQMLWLSKNTLFNRMAAAGKLP